MISFAVRFQEGETQNQKDSHKQAAHFLDLASNYSNTALKDCGDNAPSLCLLQAFILVSHGQLTQGVLGRAWRMLGTSVRLAYEMNMHLVDARGPEYALNSKRWCEDEEKRRAWWAIWEMDVFATTIRRTPTAVDWSQLETLLPVDDEHWFECKPTRSCFLQQDPILRWKALSNSENQSPKAWFIVINSLMKEAQRISSPRGIPNGSGQSWDRIDEARQRLEVIANAVHCFQLALPSQLKYKQQHLGFDARVHGEISSLRQLHCSIYNIYMMTQLARLMIYRYDVFKGRFRVALPTRESDVDKYDTQTKGKTERLAVNEYFEAADDMLTIIHRSCDDHIRYINPFLSNTIWLASAVHLMRSQLCRTREIKSAIKSRYEVLHLTYKRCVKFWDMHAAVQQNLETPEEQLEAWQQSRRQFQTERHGNISLPSRREYSPQSPTLDPDTTRSVPDANEDSITNPVIPSPPASSSVYPNDWHSGIPADDTRNATTVDMLSVPSTNPQFITDQMIPSATLTDPMFLFGSTQSQGPWIENSRAMDGELDIDWRYLQLPNELSDVLF